MNDGELKKFKDAYRYTRSERDKARDKGDKEYADILTNILAQLILVHDHAQM